MIAIYGHPIVQFHIRTCNSPFNYNIVPIEHPFPNPPPSSRQTLVRVVPLSTSMTSFFFFF